MSTFDFYNRQFFFFSFPLRRVESIQHQYRMYRQDKALRFLPSRAVSLLGRVRFASCLSVNHVKQISLDGSENKQMIDDFLKR